LRRGIEYDAVVDLGGGDGRDPVDDLAFGAWERAAKDVDVAGHPACAELGEEQGALEDEVFPAKGRCGQAVEEPFEGVLDHDLVCGPAVAAGQVAQVVVDAAGGGVTRGVGHQASTASTAGRMTERASNSRATSWSSLTPLRPSRRR